MLRADCCLKFVVLLLVCCVWLAEASAFSQLVVFGDSLSDVGNTSTSTFGLVPGPAYANGRFSNGPVYSELLSVELGLGPLTHSRAGGNNFAHGGAKTSGTGGFNGAFIDDLDEQVDAFLDSRIADPQALYVVWAGANDLLQGETDISLPVGNIVGDITRLYNNGARQFLAMNLPRLGATPSFNHDPIMSSVMDGRTFEFNDQFDLALDDLAMNLAELDLFRFDVAAFFDEAIDDPAAFGLANVTDAAAPGLSPGDQNYNTDNIVSDPDQYLFWDEVHPTAAVHALLAQQLAHELTVPDLPGDYNGDGFVDAADYTTWRDLLGARVTPFTVADGNGDGLIDQRDYEIWRLNFAQAGVSSPEFTSAHVPEPASGLPWALAGLAVVARRRRSG